jgi:ABC-type uncharacterized transport system permease subunit
MVIMVVVAPVVVVVVVVVVVATRDPFLVHEVSLRLRAFTVNRAVKQDCR